MKLPGTEIHQPERSAGAGERGWTIGDGGRPLVAGRRRRRTWVSELRRATIRCSGHQTDPSLSEQRSRRIWYVVTNEAATVPPTTRTRRPSAEVRRLILDAAHDLFASNGYRGTSTREIADRAGVAEVLLFRNFGSKAELYSTAVVLPLTEFLNEWIESSTWDWDEADTELRQREFNAKLYDVARDEPWDHRVVSCDVGVRA